MYISVIDYTQHSITKYHNIPCYLNLNINSIFWNACFHVLQKIACLRERCYISTIKSSLNSNVYFKCLLASTHI